MNPALDQRAAKKRIRRFFDEPMAERSAVVRFINELSVCAEVFIFGGALRDISLLGAPHFNSDVDTVVQVHDNDVFMDILARHGALQNKFGGYRIRLQRWNFDVWELSKTWAFSEGLVKNRGPLSLLETTFFNWDAILYDWQSGALHHAPKYFPDMSGKYLELVLQKNPNTIGALVRTLRILDRSDEITAGPNLSAFIVGQLYKTSDWDILSYEARSFTRKWLSRETLASIRARGRDWDGYTPYRWLQRQQLSLFEEIRS